MQTLKHAKAVSVSVIVHCELSTRIKLMSEVGCWKRVLICFMQGLLQQSQGTLQACCAAYSTTSTCSTRHPDHGLSPVGNMQPASESLLGATGNCDHVNILGSTVLAPLLGVSHHSACVATLSDRLIKPDCIQHFACMLGTVSTGQPQGISGMVCTSPTAGCLTACVLCSLPVQHPPRLREETLSRT